MPEVILMSPGGATETTLAAILTELQQKLEAGEAVALDAATLAALEAISTTVGNFPVDYPDAATQATLAAVLAKLNASLAVTGPLTDAELRATPVPVAGTFTADLGLPQDVFGSIFFGSRDNQIEVHFDDTNYASYLTIATTGGGSGGSHVPQPGQVRFHSGTSATGGITGTTIDVVKYRPYHGSYFAWTASFITGGVANSKQFLGAGDATNNVMVGYNGVDFGIRWRNNGVDQFIPRTAWFDKCDGSVGSGFVRSGVPEAMNPANTNIYQVEFGWFGALGWLVSVAPPDKLWNRKLPFVPVYFIAYANTAATTFLSNADLPMYLEIAKTSGATDLVVATNCWAGGTTSSKARLSDPISDRSLAETVRALITGRTTGGGGGFVDVKVNPSGALVADATGSVVALDGPTLAALETITAVGPLTNAELRDAPIPVTGTVSVTEPVSVDDNGGSITTDGTPDYRYGGGKTAATATINTSGDTTLVPCPPGQQIVLYWASAMSDPQQSVTPIITFKLGTLEPYRNYAISHWERFVGAVDADLVVNLSAGGANTTVTAHYEVI